jgi:type I restriction-modification system DNA methylase subunit
MPLFQQSVQKKFIKDLDKAKVETAYQKLIAHFGNIDVQENIRKAKEEQYQEGFLRELFVDVLGYVLNPQPNYNLITEQKNEKNSKKADGAILKNNKPIAVIELKSVKTADLQSIETQAFSYKNNQTECVYVVTSNFQKLRFYIENAVDFEEFDLFELSKERFDLLYLCLHVDNVLSDLPLRIKQASLEREENITKKLYADYSLFKQALFKDISAQNKGLDKLTLFKKTQKLLDRFLFIFFAEDKGLLPPNSVSEILNQWDKLKELDAYQPLYNRFKLYFGYLNNGHKGKIYDIFAYNGGLFAPDDLLDNLKITDNLLYNHCRVLSHYDFDTEVDTNILGHIFEHSLNEVDEVAANTEGYHLDKGKTKRKKDGIFYTPRYITKYIVESTVGELCKQKKLTLGLDNEALIKADTKKDRKLYQAKIDEYRKWLLQLTILDPACGSGAFLNQALEFLIQEHRLIDSMTAMLFGDSLIMTDNVTEILENNIFGVDINEESVEIARLSLWLRTAKIGRKLNDLSRNIKCGNSLINSAKVINKDDLIWQEAFPEVFAKGGFDVIIGNPPYVKEHTNKSAFDGLKDNPYYQGKMDLWTLFGCIAIDLLKNNGLIGFIAPNNWISNFGASIFRDKMLTDGEITKYIDFGDYKVFVDAGIQTMVYIYKKCNPSDEYSIDYLKISDEKISENELQSVIFSNLNSQKVNRLDIKFQSANFKGTNVFFVNSNIETIFDKILQKKEFNLLGEEVGNGIDVLQDFLTEKHKAILNDNELKAGQGVLILNKKEIEKLNLTDEEVKIFKPYYGTSQINRYLAVPNINDEYILYADKVFRANIDKYPNLKKHLDKLSPILTSDFAPYGLHRTREERFFTGNAIFGIRKTVKPAFSFVSFPCFVTRAFLVIKTDRIDQKVLTTLLNSSLISFWLEHRGKRQGNLMQIDKEPLLGIPLCYPKDNEPFISQYDKLISLNSDFQRLNTRFLKLLQSSFSSINVNKKIEMWYDMKFGEFRKELEKQKIAIPIKELMDYQELFDTNAGQIKEIQTKINNTEKAIDKLVYALYDLTSEEIQIIEKND